MNVVDWFVLILALFTVAGVFAAVERRDRVHEATASDEMWLVSMDDYRQRADERSGASEAKVTKTRTAGALGEKR